MKHLDEQTLVALVDGGIAPNAAPPLHAHLAGCEECRRALEDVRALVADLATHEAPATAIDAHVAAVMARVAKVPRPSTKAPHGQRFGVVLGAVALAACLALVVHRYPREEVTARGGSGGHATTSTLERRVGVDLFVGERMPVPVRDGDDVTSDAVFAATHTNLDERPAYLLLFAVDASATVHWLYPAYASANEDPISVVLPPATSPRPFGTSVVLETPAPGPMRIVALVTREPRRVSEIEARSGPSLERAALERDFGAVVIERRVRMRGAP